MLLQGSYLVSGKSVQLSEEKNKPDTNISCLGGGGGGGSPTAGGQFGFLAMTLEFDLATVRLRESGLLSPSDTNVVSAAHIQ